MNQKGLNTVDAATPSADLPEQDYLTDLHRRFAKAVDLEHTVAALRRADAEFAVTRGEAARAARTKDLIRKTREWEGAAFSADTEQQSKQKAFRGARRTLRRELWLSRRRRLIGFLSRHWQVLLVVATIIAASLAICAVLYDTEPQPYQARSNHQRNYEDRR